MWPFDSTNRSHNFDKEAVAIANPTSLQCCVHPELHRLRDIHGSRTLMVKRRPNQDNGYHQYSQNHHDMEVLH